MPQTLGRRTAVTAMTSALILPFPRSAPAAMGPMLLDDFSDPSGYSAIKSSWAGFTDRVMGGRSTGGARFDTVLGRRCLRLTGRVNTNGGGFIQMAMDMEPGGKAFDASGTQGLELDVWSNGEAYNCHIRTTDVQWYEQSYRATFQSSAQWTTVRLPWSAFVPHGLKAPLNIKALQRIGLLGWMRDFDADLALARIALF
ncbi:MAG: CIA30 family protein [Rhodospirillaceae bacterium]|nr:CIA30 family protein [Rhodospirillaceae bacterium]